LVAEVARLAECERRATASLIAALAELYGRRLHERAGYASLFTYCTEVLRLSEHEAYDRMRAAKVARRYPIVLGLLASGRLNLTTVRLLAPHLTRRNHEELLAAACGKRKRQVQELLAARFPQPDVASTIRKVPAPKSEPMSEVAAGGTPWTSATAVEVTSAPSSAPSIPAPPPPLVQPLSPDRYRITFTASGETCEMLEMAQDLLRHAIPSGDPAQIVGRALEVLVEDLVRRKFAVTPRPRASQGQADDSRNVPAEVRRAVFIRDRGGCGYVGTDGRRGGERAFLEFHHLIPYAAGGRPTVDNIVLRCRAHNAYEAEAFYGPIRECRSAAEDAGADAGREGMARVTDDALRPGTTTQGTRSALSHSPICAARAMRQYVVNHPG
jgi:hypothetical protein